MMRWPVKPRFGAVTGLRLSKFIQRNIWEDIECEVRSDTSRSQLRRFQLGRKIEMSKREAVNSPDSDDAILKRPKLEPDTTSLDDQSTVSVRGAREHNLRDVDVDIPRDNLVVFSGVSGSGKSSLAFGTVFAEAQRRYFDSVAPYVRRLIDQVGVPEVDSINGLPPAVALRQQRGVGNARSSVGSMTTLSSSFRMLYSRAGEYPPGQTLLYAEDFSPNTPQGACPKCQGLGYVLEATEESMVPDPNLTIRQRAIKAWPPAWHGQNLRDILVTLGYDVDTPWKDLPKKDRDWILFTDETPTVPVYAGLTPEQTQRALKRKAEPSYMGTFSGARRYVLQTFANTKSARMRKRVSPFLQHTLCPDCKGERLRPEPLAVTFMGLNIFDMLELPLSRLVELLEPVAQDEFVSQKQAAEANPSDEQASWTKLPKEKRLAASRLAQNIVSRIEKLLALGLGYLQLERPTPTLSAGEYQRLRLGTQLASMLFGVVYVLDEPSAGLHPADCQVLYNSLEKLRRAGNSVFVVEHDLSLMRQSQWLVDVGPGAGTDGGRVLYSGPPAGLEAVKDSQTALYLFNKVPAPKNYHRVAKYHLEMIDVHCHNVQGVDVRLPLGTLTAVTGISGSGKSSLMTLALPELLARHFGKPSLQPADEDAADALTPHAAPPKIEGQLKGAIDKVGRVVQVDQKPIGRTPRSNVATYTGLWDVVRGLFADTPMAHQKNYDAGQFSFNVAKGRCEKCEGEGVMQVELMFMPSTSAPCPVCHGTRFNDNTLKVRWKGHNVADVLAMTVQEALAAFRDQPRIARILQLLQDIGLEYMRLGQSATELSGGEAQRIKLATELKSQSRSHTLYLLDEPTTGLHARDVDRLTVQLQTLVNRGHSVVMVAHDMRAVAQADWVIDIGPGAGAQGGKVVVAGMPRTVADTPESRTAPFLAEALAAQAELASETSEHPREVSVLQGASDSETADWTGESGESGEESSAKSSPELSGESAEDGESGESGEDGEDGEEDESGETDDESGSAESGSAESKNTSPSK